MARVMQNEWGRCVRPFQLCAGGEGAQRAVVRDLGAWGEMMALAA